MIIRSKNGVTVEALENIYLIIGEIIDDDSCYYSKDEIKDLNKRDFKKLGGLLKHGRD